MIVAFMPLKVALSKHTDLNDGINILWFDMGCPIIILNGNKKIEKVFQNLHAIFYRGP